MNYEEKKNAGTVAKFHEEMQTPTIASRRNETLVQTHEANQQHATLRTTEASAQGTDALCNQLATNKIMFPTELSNSNFFFFTYIYLFKEENLNHRMQHTFSLIRSVARR